MSDVRRKTVKQLTGKHHVNTTIQPTTWPVSNEEDWRPPESARFFCSKVKKNKQKKHPRGQNCKHHPSEICSVSSSLEIKESSGAMAMSPVGWLAICCRRFSDWSSRFVQSSHISSMPGPSPPYSGGKTGGEKKSLSESWKSAPCIWICSRERATVILKVLKAFLFCM